LDEADASLVFPRGDQEAPQTAFKFWSCLTHPEKRYTATSTVVEPDARRIGLAWSEGCQNICDWAQIPEI
jgi:hypothetical protein